MPPFLPASSLPCYFRAGDVAGDYGAAAGMLVNRMCQETTPLAQLGAVIGSDTSPTVFKWDGGDGCACLKGGIGTPVGFHQVDHHLCPPNAAGPFGRLNASRSCALARESRILAAPGEMRISVAISGTE